MTLDSISAGWSLQHDGWELQSPVGCRVFLSSGERRLMQALAAQPGVTLSRPALCAAVATVHRNESRLRHGTRRVDMLVSRLRAKARQTGDELPLISVPGQGYALSIRLNAKIPA
nr:helix-turn-helix domain-containing protein [Pseudomonas sp.]